MRQRLLSCLCFAARDIICHNSLVPACRYRRLEHFLLMLNAKLIHELLQIALFVPVDLQNLRITNANQ